MGAADVVPGVSGGTIAFISGIYEELIGSLKKINLSALTVLLREGPAAAWRFINGNFLLTLFTGVGVSILSLARVISYSLEHYPIHVWSFFFGLIIASVFFIVRQLESWHWQQWLALGVGTAVALSISMAKPAQLPDEGWIVFLAGSIAICAMILPGVSGSFILLLMGMYSVIINALKNFDLILLISFGGGCVCGLLAFSHILSWLLKHYHSVTLATLTGFLLGSLNVIWPWKQTLEYEINRHGKQVPLVQENLLPGVYQQITGADAYLEWALMLGLLGLILVLALEFLAPRIGGGSNQENV